MLRKVRWMTALAAVPMLAFALNASTAGAASGDAAVPGFGHVFVIVGENTNLSQLNMKNAPYQLGTIRNGATTAWLTNYWGASHYSTSNYVAMTSGQFIDCEQADVKPIGCHQDVTNIFGQLEAKGTSWTAWNESMPSPCYLLNAGEDRTGNAYRPKHNPAEYYVDVVGDYADPSSTCTDNVIAMGDTTPNDKSAFESRLATGNVSRFNYIAPNMCEDAHDNCKPIGNPIKQFDEFLRREVPLIEASPAYGTDGVIVIVYDEGQNGGPNIGDKFGGGNVPFAVISPLVHHAIYPDLHNHYDLLRTLEDGFGLGYAGNAATANPISEIWSP